MFLEWEDFALFGVVSLSVVRKFSAPSSGNRPLRHAVCGAASALRADIAPSLAVPVRSIVRWSAGQSSAARALATSSFRGSRSLFGLAAFLPCSLVTAPRVAFVGGLLMPSARSSLGSLVIGGGGGASSSCYRRVW